MTKFVTNITPELLLNAYANGYFPMAESREASELRWFSPEMRGILPLDNFHVPRTLAKLAKKAPYHITLNQDFNGVIRACADRKDTWINDEIIALYCELHQLGFAHSVEVWGNNSPPPQGGARGGAGFPTTNNQQPITVTPPTLTLPLKGGGNIQLIGGLYGVALGGAFFGESMFSRAPNASKLALLHLVEYLKNAGYTLLDAQYTNEHLQQFGIMEIPRAEYLQRLEKALRILPQPLNPNP